MVLVKALFQVTGLIHPFGFAFVLAKDVAGHGAVFIRFVW